MLWNWNERLVSWHVGLGSWSLQEQPVFLIVEPSPTSDNTFLNDRVAGSSTKHDINWAMGIIYAGDRERRKNIFVCFVFQIGSKLILSYPDRIELILPFLVQGMCATRRHA